MQKIGRVYDLALLIANARWRKENLSRLKAPRSILEKEREFIKRLLTKAKKEGVDSQVKKIMPTAMKEVKRNRTILFLTTDTLLHEFEEVVEGQVLEYVESHENYSVSTESKPESFEESLKALFESLSKNERQKIECLDALGEVLFWIEADLYTKIRLKSFWI